MNVKLIENDENGNREDSDKCGAPPEEPRKPLADPPVDEKDVPRPGDVLKGADEKTEDESYLRAFRGACKRLAPGEKVVKVLGSRFGPDARPWAGWEDAFCGREATEGERKKIEAAGWRYQGREGTGFRDATYYDLWRPEEGGVES